MVSGSGASKTATAEKVDNPDDQTEESLTRSSGLYSAWEHFFGIGPYHGELPI